MEGRHRVEISLEGDGPRRKANSTFAFAVTPRDEEDLRWYLEDFLQYPEPPAPAIAKRIEGRLEEIGEELFRAVFHANEDARDLWSRVRERLPETRIEIATEVTEAGTIPWELLREPKTTTALALVAHAFVRAHPNASLAPQLPTSKKGKIRILLVLCRPRGGEDVPFRSVASQLLRGLRDANREAYDLDLLRPPTFEQLGKALREAHREGKPYHVVHFDGHGAYLEVEEPKDPGESGGFGALLRQLSPMVLGGPRAGKHGYLWFENPRLEDNGELVDGTSVGKLLAATGVSVLVLNACRSAHADPALAPDSNAALEASDPHSQVRAFGSLAQEVMDAGVAGVVAMRYNVYVVTAAQFVADLYAGLVRGAALGEAVTLARKSMAEQPYREVVYEALPLQDWTVPVVYEAAPLRIFPKVKDEGRLKIRVAAGVASGANQETTALDAELPALPDAGFFGRDETLLALDRAFDSDSIVLLHAYAGSGKTTTAAEFARWYSLTGGVDGPVLFTTFERYLPLPRVLDRIGQVFGAGLEGAGTNWLALDDRARREVALQVLAQGPVLWIWDNTEPVAGFPAGTESAWSTDEREELLDFLRALRETKAKLLLTSRRDEQAWLGDLPRRIAVPRMPMTESLQLVRALAAKYGQRLPNLDDWRPLLMFAQGNPMTLTVVVRQALRDGSRTRAQIEAYVARLRAGEAAFPDEVSEGRSRSLGASLAYGFEQAFGEDDRKKLALLHLFQGFVEVAVLRIMGNPESSWCLPEVRGLTREGGIALLDRAAEVGLLAAHGGGYYGIHPALPWFFKGLFDQFYSAEGLTAVRAFVEAMGEVGTYYHDEFEDGNRKALAVLQAEEANLLHARRLARSYNWWRQVIESMQGLRRLYDYTGRRAEWKRLVDEIVPNFVDPGSEGFLPGREEEWSLVTNYRVRLAGDEREWGEAERLLTMSVDWNRQRATPALVRPRKELESAERNMIRTLAASLHELGEVRRELGRVDCIPAYEEPLELLERIGDRGGSAACAFNLGHVFKDLAAPRDLDKAEEWYRKSVELRDKHDRLGLGKCLGQLGLVAFERFSEAQVAGGSSEDYLRHLSESGRLFREALTLLPADAVNALAMSHNHLGSVYTAAGELDHAVEHFRESIQLEENQGNLFGAARARFNMAVAFLKSGRRADALEYAEAALRGFESYGERAAEQIEKTRRLIAAIRGA
ncbi:MAG TPA: tetratricopeptide repeat protein [Thermoanaerobaculia bacterium]|nr:tetratricopeptide repeat protein [Thermoanaerobaculia bacterium]